VFVHPESITFSDIFWVTKDVVASEWVGGDRPVVEVFHLVENGARMVFNEGARAGFEFWHTTILLNDAAMGTDGNYQATTTQIWKWDGNQYKLVTTVPYNRRIEALAKLSDEVDR